MRVAHRDEDCLDRAGAGLELDLVGLSVKVRRQVSCTERRAADVELADDLSARPRQDPDGVGAVERPQVKPLRRAVLEHGVGGGDAQPVPALLGLGAVGVEDPHAHDPRVEGDQAVRAEA